MDQSLYNKVNQFLPSEDITSISTYGEGHIHETYHVETKDHHPDYILQKINHNVFEDITGMMKNIETVTSHIRQKLHVLPGHDPDLESLTLIYTRSGQLFYQDEGGNYWRMYVFIPDTVCCQQMADPLMAFESGKAIGFFQAMLSDLEIPLVDTIPGFHNIEFRISQYLRAKESGSAGRLARVPAETVFIEKRFERMQSYYKSLQEKAVVRPTHNDTKVNNILFDLQNRAQCLIDLDTVMPGYVHFDYGDALRTMANTAPEDEKDLSKVRFNDEIYHAFTSGYMQEAGNFLSKWEIQLLPYAPVYLTFIIGLRFLTDHLNGDVYYRIHHPGHNLERARVQFKLVKEMEKILNFEF